MNGAMDAAHSAAPLIELRSVRRRYGGGEQPEVEVLRGVSLRIHAGEFVAIVGASGSGQVHADEPAGLRTGPAAASTSSRGRTWRAWARTSWPGCGARRLALSSRATTSSARNRPAKRWRVPAVYAGLPRSERAERASALLNRLGLAGKQHLRPTQLSGGQQQRVSIARALMNVSIILADEPTGALDTHSGAEVMALLHELADAGHTIVLITHDREVAAQARRVIEIHDGQIVADSGAPAPVLGFEVKLPD